jgi:micrococcal nuclease
MGDLIPFRGRKKTWTRPEDYVPPEPGPDDWAKVLPAAKWRGAASPLRRGSRKGRRRRSGWGAAWRAVRAWMLLIALVTLWFAYREAGAFEPPRFLEGEPIRVAGPFTRCGEGRAPLCVVDGDTLKLGERTMRLVGLDAPETKGRCPAETAAAERATRALQRWANAGPFILAARLDAPTDKRGRALMTARRGDRTAAEAMVAQGVARPYAGEARQTWC